MTAKTRTVTVTLASCPSCYGRGYRMRRRLTITGYSTRAEVCRRCGGSSEIEARRLRKAERDGAQVRKEVRP